MEKKSIPEVAGTWWVPRKNTAIHIEFSALPKIDHSVVAKIIKYEMQHGPCNPDGSQLCSYGPGWEFTEGIFYITTHDWVKWRPNSNEMIEITHAEYARLTAKKISTKASP